MRVGPSTRPLMQLQTAAAVTAETASLGFMKPLDIPIMLKPFNFQQWSTNVAAVRSCEVAATLVYEADGDLKVIQLLLVVLCLQKWTVVAWRL